MSIEVSRLPNGLTVVTDPMPHLESVAAGVWVNCGSRHETKRVMGVSHMLEHMAFKGTKRRTAQMIAEEIEAVGGFLNAYTGREQTAFYARVLRDDTALALDILADILINPVFDQGELERERQVVLQEIGQTRDTPDDLVFDHLQSAAFPDQPIGWPILGDEKTVSAFTRDDLSTYMRDKYRAGGMVLIASGAVDHGSVRKLADEYFAALPAGGGPERSPAHYAGGDIRHDEDLEQVHATFAVPGLASAHPDAYALHVYVAALGGGMSSRLFQEARERRGLCYSIYAFTNSYTDGGIVGVYAGTGAKEAGEIAPLVAGEMAALAEKATEQETARARAQLKASLFMGLERPSARCEQIAGQLLAYGRIVSVEEQVAKLEAVDAEAVRGIGARLMASEQPAIAAIGPIGRLEPYADFSRRFGTARTA